MTRRLVLSHVERKAAERLICATATDGADATTNALDHLHPDAYPALIAYLASVAVDARQIPRLDAQRYRHGQADQLTDAQRRRAHRRYLDGERTLEVVTGEREYQRVWRRNRRQGKSA